MKTINFEMDLCLLSIDYEVVENVLKVKAPKGVDNFYTFDVFVKNDCVKKFIVNDVSRSVEASDTFKVNTVHTVNIINGEHCYCIGLSYFKVYYTAFNYQSPETFIIYFADTDSNVVGALSCEFSEGKILVNEVVL